MSDSAETTCIETDLTQDPVRWRILLVLLITIFMSLVAVSIVNVSLPSIQHGLHASNAAIQWVLSGYALTFGVVLVAAGRAGDIMGRGGIFIIGVAIFTVASVVAGLAPDATWLNVARFVQGIGSGLLNPQGLGMIQQYFRGSERGRAFGYFGSTVGVSVGIGPVLGGLLIQLGGVEIGWRLTFLVNVPFGIAAIILALIWFPRPLISLGPDHDKGQLGRAIRVMRSLDPVGSIVLGLAVFAVLLPFVESRTSMLTWLFLPLGLCLAGFWVVWEKHYARMGRSPMVNLNIFATRSFSNGSIIMALYFLGMTSIWVLVALYVQDGDGKTALESGLLGVPSSFLAAIASNWAGRHVMRYGRIVVFGGLFFALLGMVSSIAVVLLHESGQISVWWLLLSLSFVGIGQGAVVSPNQALTLADVPLSYAGSSGAIMQTGQRIGTSVGIAMITAAVFACLATTSWAISVSIGFALISLVIVLALVVAWKDMSDRRQFKSEQQIPVRATTQ